MVRLVMFLAMGAFLIAALCVPRSFGADALAFAAAYAVVRVAHILLFVLASREDAELRRSVVGLALSTAIGAGLLLIAAFTGGALQLALWGTALVLDAGGPFVFGQDGWRLVPAHFAERHGAIVIIALGESIVAIGVGAHEHVDAGIVCAAALALVLAACLWWAYFDVTSIVAGRFLERAEAGREQNGIARDSYSYLHFPMVAGIGLLAVGLRLTIAHVSGPLGVVPAFALLGGTAAFLLAQVAFRLRVMHSLSVRRLLTAVVLLAALALHAEVSAIALLGIATGLLVAMIGYEATRYADVRDRVRHSEPERA
jgi:low temperature requirement protein LtrA